MNDRINDLMYRAGLTAQGCWDEMDDYDHRAILKFAELIVAESAKICADTAVTNPPNDLLEGYNMGVNKAVENIKQHFGVEE